MDSGISPLRTISIAIGTVVSTPGMPPGASLNPRAFSSTVWGAWSEPNIAMSPAANLR
jgi:hypothetical protein